MSNTSFLVLNLKPEILKNLSSLNYTKMTPIQTQSIPHILNKKDVIAKAKTGSGKTVAFGVGIVSILNVKHFKIQVLVLCPTRELADQVGKEIRKLARGTHNVKLLSLCGGVPMRGQLESLKHGAHIVVGTPGRIQAHLDKGTLNLNNLKMLILDEADRMLDMGFYDDIKKIIDITPKNRQTLLFSATFPKTIRNISDEFQKTPIEISVDSAHDKSIIKQLFYEIPKGGKLKALIQLLDNYQPETSIVFCNTKAKCQDVAEYLNNTGFHAIDIHGDLEQRERTEALIQFANRSCSILVATDVASRGLDIKDIKAVISFDIAHDLDIHIHRIGRTGRAGKDGMAISLYSSNELKKLDAIQEYQDKAFLEKNQIIYKNLNSLDVTKKFEHKPPMMTLCIHGGRKNKVRAGDILGALTKDAEILGKSVGKIDVLDFFTYIAIERKLIDIALNKIKNGKIKGKNFRAWRI